MLRPFAHSLAVEFQEWKRQWRDETFWCLAIASLNPDPISENNMWFSLLFQTWTDRLREFTQTLVSGRDLSLFQSLSIISISDKKVYNIMRKVIFIYARLQIHQAWNIWKILKP